MRRQFIFGGLAAVAGLLAWRIFRHPQGLSEKEWAARHANPIAPPVGPLSCYHLGHSLVGRDMPAMLAQVAHHSYHSQLGWGTSLADHWSGNVQGFATENAHPAHLPAKEALASGRYDAVIFTEMVELKDAIRWHDSASHLAKWAALARQNNAKVRLYLYETWHRLGDPAGWLDRLENDLATLWEGAILRKAMADNAEVTLYVIPGGQVMAAAVREIEAGRITGLHSRQDLFTDDIHPNDIGNWLIAMTHFATLYHRSPVGLPAQLHRADGSPATPPHPDAARTLQEVVWRVVTSYRATGVAQSHG